MKIAFDAQTLFEDRKTGIGWTIKQMIDHMPMEEGNEYQLNCFTFRHKKQKKEILRPYIKKGYKVRRFNYCPLGLCRRLWRYVPVPYSLFMGKADITQFFNFIIPPGVKGKKLVYIYDMVYKAMPETMDASNRNYMEANMKKSCERADGIITISEFSKSEIIKYMDVPAEKVHVVPCGVDLDEYNTMEEPERVCAAKDKYGISGDYFLYLGTLEPRKNIGVIIDGYYKLKERSDDPLPALVIAGKKGWNYQNIFEKVQKYGLEADVIFTDYIDEKDKIGLLKGAICFVFPSLYEGFGMPPLEAMACGVPVIVSRQASLPEVVGDAGIMVDYDDSDMLSDSLEKLWKDENYRLILAEAGSKRAEMFTWNAAARKLHDVYKRYYSLN